MTIYNNKIKLKTAIERTVLKSSKPVAKKMVKSVKKTIDETIYKSNSPKEYERTFTLKNSIIDKVEQDKNKVIIEIMNDKNQLEYYSVQTQGNIGDSILEIVIDGKAGKIFGEGFWTKKRNYIKDSAQDLKKTKLYTKEFVKEMGKNGLTLI